MSLAYTINARGILCTCLRPVVAPEVFEIRIDFRLLGYSGKVLLSVSSSAPDPERLSSTNFFCIARLLFDHLVGDGEQRCRHFDAEQSGGLQVDDKFELGRPDDRQVGRFLALENAAHVDADLALDVRNA